MKFFEDIAIGERAELGPHTFTVEDVIERAFHEQAGD